MNHFIILSGVEARLENGLNLIKGVLTGIVVLVGIIAALIIIIKHLPSISDPQEKNAMWKGVGNVLIAVGAGAALIWILPWIFSIFS